MASPPPLPPPLTQGPLTTPSDRQAALRLVADSIAQQRQLAARSLISHPATLSLLVVLLAVIHRLNRAELSAQLMFGSAATMTLLLAARYATSGYIARAEAFRWAEWLHDGDEVLGVRFGDDMVGALVLRVDEERRTGAVRAWTTRLKYRRRGVGGDLLREAAAITRRRCGPDYKLVFAKDHANSDMVLPDMFNGVFRTRNAYAQRALEKALAEQRESSQ